MGERDIIIWSLVLLGVVLVGFVAVAQLKKRLVQPDSHASAGFTLADLRALHRSGKMTDEEFARAKEALIAGIKKPNQQADTSIAKPDQAGAGGPDRPSA